MATILSIIALFAPKVALPVPAAVFASTAERGIEIAAHANDVATEIMQRHEWQLLKDVATVTGDGSATSFSLPADYDRMLKNAALHSAAYASPYRHEDDLNAWLAREVQDFDQVVPSWIVYGGRIHIKPTLADGITAKFAYMKNAFVDPASASVTSVFTADDDEYLLRADILRTQMIWKWKAAHGQPFSEDMETAEDRFELAASADAGAGKVIRLAAPRIPAGVTQAYPVTVGV
jgi:hypothetical protein